MKTASTLLFLFIISSASAQRDSNLNTIPAPENWSYHFQFTGIMQGHPDFQAPYSGANSLGTKAEQDFSVTTTFYLGRKLWKGASIYVNPEMAGGKGLSSTLGIAGFTNGECFRIGYPSPTLYLGRIFLRQYFALGKDCGCDTANSPTCQNQLCGEVIPKKRITLTAGKFSLADMFDNNSCSKDPRTRFMNWSLMSNGAWDYPANTRGYTWGFALEYITPSYAVRFAETAEPLVANGSDFDWNVVKSRGETMELEKDYRIHAKKGAIRLLLYRNLSRAGIYKNAINSLLSGTDTSMNVNTGTSYTGVKYGICLNAEQNLSDNVAIFARAGWNDGRSATWAFTEIDQTISAGINIKGSRWKRPDDMLGIAIVANGISNDHWDFLNYGGYGFLIGDGKLPHYGSETIGEVFYSVQLAKSLWFSGDYQYVQNPAYNRDRGPVNVWALRAHVEF
jgi:high affinity Mn2+ porin